MANEKRLIPLQKRIIYAGDVFNYLMAEKRWSATEAAAFVKDFQTVDAVEVVHGMWVSSGCGFDCCSKCRMVYADGYLTAMGIKPRTQFNYCPNCGAKMDGDGNG